MWQRFKQILGINSFPLNKIYLSHHNLVSNYNYISSLNSEVKIAPVLKSNAYGHGLALIGKLVDELKAPFICVDSLYEALVIKKAGIKTPILIMGYVDPRSLQRRKMPFSYAVFDLEYAKAINQFQKGSGVHIFVDTGMNREGVRLEDLSEFIDQLKLLSNLKIEGLMTHFASADEPNEKINDYQISSFEKAKKICSEAGLEIKWFHCGGSYTLLNSLVKKDIVNVIRSGKSLYGYGDGNLKPVLCMKTKIVQIKNIRSKEKVGYNCTFQANNDMMIGILPLGYNDGVDRRLSNKGVVLVGGVECPIIGRVSMNITTVDLSAVKNPYVGQEVTVFSNKPQDKNSLQNSAKLCETIIYELLVHLHPSTRREVV